MTISETRDPGSCFLTVTANDADGVCYFQLFIYGAIFVPLARSQWRLSSADCLSSMCHCVHLYVVGFKPFSHIDTLSDASAADSFLKT